MEKGNLRINQTSIFYYCITLLLLFFNANCFAAVIKILPNTIITGVKTYDNVTLDMSSGSFIVKNKGILTIKNSEIIGSLSKDLPVLISVESGTLTLRSNDIKISANTINPHPGSQSLYYVAQIGTGKADIRNNIATINMPFAAGFLITTSLGAYNPTSGFQITGNKFENFHGVLYLIASNNALIANNTFSKNSYGHIVVIGRNEQILNNTIYFSGNDHLGNAIDVVDSENVQINNNKLFSPTCHGIYVLSSNHVTVDSNIITGGITYAMNVLSFPEPTLKQEYIHFLIAKHKIKHRISSNIIISNNYMAQNRFGIAVSDTDDLLVKDNYFIQRFIDSASRKFWTDNNILLKNVTNLTWTGNFYKEAFSQSVSGDNSKSFAFVPFPISDGVTL